MDCGVNNSVTQCSVILFNDFPSTQIIFCVRNTQIHQVLKGQDVARILKNKFRKQKSDFLVFRALQVATVSE